MDMKVFDDAMMAGLVEQAKASPRLRANLNVHEDLNEPVQRLFIAMEPGSYVQPHRHIESYKWEFFMAVRGRLVMLVFDDNGTVTRREELASNGAVNGVELPPNVWHTVIALDEGSLFYEIKQGPYAPMTDKGFATWAPKESAPEVAVFYQWLTTANVGDTVPNVT
ncbi:WbuC family cupin fold metalloprotein [Pseudomonadota bacterium]